MEDALYIHTNKTKDEFIAEIEKVLSERREDVDVFKEENYTAYGEVFDVIEGDYFVLSIFKNDEYDEAKCDEFPDGYSYFRYVIEPDFTDYCKEKEYLSLMSVLLNTFWDSGMRVVAICEFSELLPNEGGYNKRINY